MSRKQIRVLMLLPNLRVSNGVTSYAMNYYRALDHDFVKMDFLTYKQIDNPYENEILKSGGKVFTVPPIKKLLNHIDACNKILQNGKYDIIHDNSLLITYPMMKIATKYVPVRILHSHNSQLGETKTKEKRNRLLLPLLIKEANSFAACSDLAAKAMFRDKEYSFIPNVINEKKYFFDQTLRKSVRNRMGVENRKVIATVGRVSKQKNPFFAANVFNKIAEKDPFVEYWWIGSGPLSQSFIDYTHKLKHGDRIHYMGSRNDVMELYQAIDLFFLPSLFEGLPVTGIEAQAMGLPCVISSSITKEMVYTDLVKFLDLNAGIEKWANTILEIVNNEKTRRSYTQELHNSRFSDENAGILLQQYYLSELQTKGVY